MALVVQDIKTLNTLNSPDNVSSSDANQIAEVLDISSIEETSIDHYTTAELPEILNKLQTYLVTKMDIDPKHLLEHLTAFVKRASTISTSMEARLKPGAHIAYKLKLADGSVKQYKMYDCDIFEYVRSWKDDVDNPNPVRKLCCTLEVLHEWLARRRPDIYETKRTTRLGLPKGKAYLGADFLSGNVSTMSEVDRAILLRSSEVALSRPSRLEKTSLTSLYDMIRSM